MRASLTRWRGILAGAVSGVLLAMSFPPAALALLAWVALVPLFLHLLATRGRQVVAPFLLFGIAFFTTGLFWLEPVLTPVGPFLLSIVLTGLFIWPISLAARALLRRDLSLLLVGPLFFLVSEWLRTWLFTGFPWLFIAHGQVVFPHFVQTADLFGTQGITALIVFMNAAIARAAFKLRERDYRAAFAPLILGLALVGAFVGYGHVRLRFIEERPGPTLLLVQGNVPQYMKTEALRRQDQDPQPVNRSLAIFRRHVELTLDGLRRHPEAEVVIWPETMFSYPMSDQDGPGHAGRRHAAMIAFRALSRAVNGRPAIVGALYRTKQGKARNSVFLVDSQGNPSERYDKVHAVPGGEYIPFRKIAPDALVQWVGEIIRENAGFVPDLTEGEKPLLITAAGTKFGPLICYEVMYPGLVRDLRDLGAEVLLNITNYGWFPDTHEPLQANQMAVFRAIEARRPVVVSANTGVSALITATGAITELEVGGKRMDVPGTLAVTVPLCDSGSVSATVGDFPGLLAALALITLLIRSRYGVRFAERRPESSD